jgi:hypothetical protein
MQRLDFKEDEVLTRKEYLKRKKKQSKSYKKISKITVLFTSLIAVLSIYIVIQFSIYNSNSYKYITGDGVNDQKVYGIYYLTAGYTYEPNYSLNYIASDGFDDKTVAENVNLSSVLTTQEYIYGIKNNGLYSIKKSSPKDLELILEKNVSKFAIKENDIYVITADTKKVIKINALNLEKKEFNIENVSELIVDDNYIFVAVINSNSKRIDRYDRNGDNGLQITKNSNVSYMIDSKDRLYYVNKGDSNKIYYANKDGSKEEKLADINCVADTGSIKQINGYMYMFVSGDYLYYVNKSDSDSLWRININDKKTEKVISMSVELLQNVDNTVFYRAKNENGVYLYNYDTKFMSQVTKNKVSEFYIDSESQIDQNRKNNGYRN